MITIIRMERHMGHYSRKRIRREESSSSPFSSPAVGIALDAPGCILNNTKAAKEAGASVQEIMEAFAVAKFSKGATVMSSSLAALEWLTEN
ncbi:MAG: carboxymuconolactone decarboxylase family protein [Rectinemataceae bacterium]|nr:carboxymuconolactone decarboxylase family protein [Rectinemataceae bacterium]